MNDEIKEALTMMFEVMSSKEFVESVANFTWNLFTELKLKGFTEDQAMQIVASMSKSNK